MSDIPKARAILQSLIDSSVKLKRKVIAGKIKEAIDCMKREPMTRPRGALTPRLSTDQAKAIHAYVNANPHESFDSVAAKFNTSRSRATKAWLSGEAGIL